MPRRDEAQRVWLLVGVALAALFLLRTTGIVFQGALTGLGMYVAIIVVFAGFPAIKRALFSFGRLADMIISFGLPYLLASVLGITGATMLIATIACGLLFTFNLKMKELGGPIRAATGTSAMIITRAKDSFEAWRKEFEDEQLDPRGRAGRGRTHHAGMRGEREEEASPDRDHRRTGDHARREPRLIDLVQQDDESWSIP